MLTIAPRDTAPLLRTMTSSLPNEIHGALPITAVERETGISKDTLRAWEKRYGFPQPLRDAADDRLYPLEQVQRLKLIRRLLDAGHRPGKVAHLSNESICELLDKIPDLSKTNQKAPAPSEEIRRLLSAIESHHTALLRDDLQRTLMRKGLGAFVTEVVAPLTTAVGESWAQGRFEVFEEHLYTEVVTNVLRSSLGNLKHSELSRSPKVLLTTFPQEMHGLGLLMVEALLTLEGCECISLGTQTPITDIARAAHAHQVDVVALSFSNVHSPASIQTGLRSLRSELDAAKGIWVGGSCQALYQKHWEGITAMQALQGIPALVTQWRETP